MNYSLSDKGEILELFISTKGSSSRTSMSFIEVDLGGVIDDKFYGKEIERSVLISSIYSYSLAGNKNIALNLGELGENILMDYNPYQLPVGSKLQIGTVILEITKPCTLCKSLTSIDKRLPKLLKDDRGIFSKVIQEGVINLNDKIYLI